MSTTLTTPTESAWSRMAMPSARDGILALAEIRWAGAATVLFAVGAALQAAGGPTWLWWIFYLGCYSCGGWEPGLAGLRAAAEKTLDVDLLMIVAAVVAACIGQIIDGALLIVIFAASGALEAFATKRTADSVRALLDLAPEQATRLQPDGTEQRVDTATLAVDDLVLVRPGELISADAVVVDGGSEVDQASITGEPLPVFKEPGDEVFAGTFNRNGALRIQVLRAASDSVVARIVALVEEASKTKAQTQLFLDTVEQRYSVVMVLATVALFVIPIASGSPVTSTLLRAMTFMIVASPCAVVLATMPPLLSAIANAGRHGVLVKSAVVTEQFGLIDVVAFDKTGTLTDGRPRVAEIAPLPTSGLSDDQLLALAAAAERPSEHPIAVAIVPAAHARGFDPAAATEFGSTPGRGVSARIEGQLVGVGSPALMNQLLETSDKSAVQLVVQRAESAGRTAVVVIVDDLPVGVISLADQLRPEALTTTATLTRLSGHLPVLLTGDNAGAAGRLAEEVGITEIHSGLLPADKVRCVKALQSAGRHVLLVGDGVNDAPALAAANLGVAMGRHGSDLALETSDAVLVRDELATLPRVIALSRRTRKVVLANLGMAVAVITTLVIWDLIGHLPLPLGVALHEGSTVVVGLNGLRLLRQSAWEQADAYPEPIQRH